MSDWSIYKCIAKCVNNIISLTTHLGWPGGVGLGTLECAPLKVSVLIPPGAYFRWASPYITCSGFKWPPHRPQLDGGVGPLGLVCFWAGYLV